VQAIGSAIEPALPPIEPPVPPIGAALPPIGAALPPIGAALPAIGAALPAIGAALPAVGGTTALLPAVGTRVPPAPALAARPLPPVPAAIDGGAPATSIVTTGAAVVGMGDVLAASSWGPHAVQSRAIERMRVFIGTRARCVERAMIVGRYVALTGYWPDARFFLRARAITPPWPSKFPGIKNEHGPGQ
jgi:hypothetical protein